MHQCRGFKRNSERCTATVEPPQEYCWLHDPANAEQRQRSASKAAKSKPHKELQVLKDQLQTIADEVISGKLDTKRATAATQALQAKIRAVEVERRVREVEEVEVALYELEQRAMTG